MLLSVENLHVSYGQIRALQGISFEIDEGEIVCIIGANGAGKSTTLQAISRMIPAEAGSRMTYMDKDLLGYSADKVVSELAISHVPEGRRLFENLTVMENLRLACFARKDTGVKTRHGTDFHDLFAAGGAPTPEGRDPQRRRAADAGRRPGLHERTEAHAAG